jgi:hypothetical protein
MRLWPKVIHFGDESGVIDAIEFMVLDDGDDEYGYLTVSANKVESEEPMTVAIASTAVGLEAGLEELGKLLTDFFEAKGIRFSAGGD